MAKKNSPNLKTKIPCRDMSPTTKFSAWEDDGFYSLFQAGKDRRVRMSFVESELGGGNSNIFYFHPHLGKIPILTNTFQMG